jgi:hypothetical protein
MVRKLSEFIANCSRSWWKFLLFLGGQLGTMAVLMSITGRFPAVTGGYEPFDMQNTLSAEDIFVQLATYTPEAFRLYWIFQAVDYLFPLFAGLMLATAGTFALRHAAPGLYAQAVERATLPLFLLPTVFDWLENLNLLWVAAAWPDQAQVAATLGVVAKLGKLATLNIVFVTVGILLAWAAVRWIGRRTAG